MARRWALYAGKESEMEDTDEHKIWMEESLARSERAGEPYTAWVWAREALTEARLAGFAVPDDVLGTGKWPKTQRLAQLLEDS